MTCTILPFSKEDTVLLRCRLKDVYLEGECYALALALHEGLGWPIIGLMRETSGTFVPWHAGVRCPNGQILDARGPVDESAFGGYFLSPPFALMTLQASDLYNIRPIDDYSIADARQLAESLWPDLPWKNPLSGRILAFADAIEQVCRAHGFWLREPFPTMRPIVYVSDGSEEGFVMTRLPCSAQFTLGRLP